MHDHTEFPLLAKIDRARDDGAQPFASDPHAPALEARARELAAEYWPETVWFTGAISRPLFNAVALRLDAERAEYRRRVRVFVASETPATRPV